MSNQSPLEIVQQEHGSKAELAKEVFGLLDHPEDEDEAHDLEYHVQTMSNRKLLRLWKFHQVMNDEFGSKSGLIDAIVDATFPGGNDEYADSLEDETVANLLDLARQQGLVASSDLGWRP